MQKTIFKYISVVVLWLFIVGVHAQPQKEIKSLNGYWSFSLGDDFDWRSTDHNFSAWDKIYTRQSWESQGYDGYNGYAWYKRAIKISGEESSNGLSLRINNIDDADEVYFNGTLIGKSGGFPPNIQTTYNQVRNYKIPAQLVNTDQYNIIAIRVYDFYQSGGIMGDIGLYKDVASDYYLQDLTGEWEFALADDSDQHNLNNIKDWAPIYVPAFWESQGYDGYDGIAWYKKTFYWKGSNTRDNLVFVLGRIDDSDIAFLNGKQIGSIEQIKNSGVYDSGKQNHRTLRAYEVSKDMLREGQNTITIKVRDTGIDGGIYEGPVGIMTKSAFQSYFKDFEETKDLFDYIWDSFFE
ncbi:glycoside hydrolase [Labilibacter sediminis]|nr:glycoside hydrolase [Labilibacter sediminis]